MTKSIFSLTDLQTASNDFTQAILELQTSILCPYSIVLPPGLCFGDKGGWVMADNIPTGDIYSNGMLPYGHAIDNKNTRCNLSN
jgi:hypothetical protein